MLESIERSRNLNQNMTYTYVPSAIDSEVMYSIITMASIKKQSHLLCECIEYMGNELQIQGGRWLRSVDSPIRVVDRIDHGTFEISCAIEIRLLFALVFQRIP